MERNIKRGDIFYIRRQPVVGHEVFTGRPGIIVSNDVNNRNSEVVEVVFLTTQPKASRPTHVKILSAKAPSIALCEQITSVSTDRIGDLYGHCTEDEMRQINEAMLCSLNLNNEVVSQISRGTERSNGVNPRDVVTLNPDCDKRDSESLIVKAEAERDVYKAMYEQLLSKMIKDD